MNKLMKVQYKNAGGIINSDGTYDNSNLNVDVFVNTIGLCAISAAQNMINPPQLNYKPSEKFADRMWELFFRD